MQRKSLHTYYQPILDLQQSEIVGFEALNRPVSAIFNNVDSFYDFIGTSRQVFAFETLCRNLSIQRFHERLSREEKQYMPLLFLQQAGVDYAQGYAIGRPSEEITLECDIDLIVRGIISTLPK